MGASLIANLIYDSINTYSVPSGSDYAFYSKISEDDLLSLFIQNYMVKIEANYPFIPVWSHIMYAVMKLKYEWDNPKLKTIMPKVLSSIAKWVLFYFIQNTPYPEPITSWELVKFCTIYTISKLIGLNLDETNKVVDWLTIPIPLSHSLLDYYENRLTYMKSDTELKNVEYLVELYYV